MNKYWKHAIRFIAITFLLAPLIIVAESLLRFLYLLSEEAIKQIIAPVNRLTTPSFWRLQEMAIVETSRSLPNIPIVALIIASILSIFLVYLFRRTK